MSDLKNNHLIRKYIEWNRFGQLLGMDFEIPEAGKAIYTMTISQLHLATPFAAHGGSVAALMDAALGVACLSQVCREERIVSTVTLNIMYMHPALLNDRLTVTAEVTKAGKRLLFVEGKVHNQNGTIVASATATMNAYPLEKADYSTI